MCNEIGEIMTCQTWIWTEGLSESLDRCSTNRTSLTITFLSIKWSPPLNITIPILSLGGAWLTNLSVPGVNYLGNWMGEIMIGQTGIRAGAPEILSFYYRIQTGLTITNARVLHMYYFNNILLIVWNVVWMHVWDKSCNIQY